LPRASPTATPASAAWQRFVNSIEIDYRSK
jgi:hypothetical protein